MAICVIPSEVLADRSTADRNHARNGERIRFLGFCRLPEKFCSVLQNGKAYPISKVPIALQPHLQAASWVS